MARNEIATVEVKPNGVIFDFGKYGMLNASLDGLSPEVITRLAVHGLRQKVGDTYAGVAQFAAKEGGEPQELAAQWASETYTSLRDKGIEGWSEKREGGGEGSLSLLAEAIARFKNDGEDAKAKQVKLAAMTKDQRQNLRAHPPIASIIADIRAERARAAAAADKPADQKAIDALAGL